MSASILERVRSLYEDIEEYENAFAELLVTEPKNHRDEMIQQYRSKIFVDKILSSQESLNNILSDDLLQKEIESIKGYPITTALYSVFYQKLGSLKDYHRKFPGLRNESHEARNLLSEQALKFSIEAFKAQWNPEEGLGRYLDMHGVYTKLLNLPGMMTSNGPMYSYTTYLTLLKDQGYVKVPNSVRVTADYLEYLKELKGVLIHFLERARPLVDLKARQDQNSRVFEKEWNEKTFKPLTGESSFGENNLDADESVIDELNCLLPWNSDLEKSSTFICPCSNKPFKETVWPSHLKSKKHIKRWEIYTRRIHDIMYEEAIIFDLSADLLESFFEATIENVQRRQSRMIGEASDELEDDVDNEDDTKSNKRDREIHRMKKNYPIGPDGTPMPYWLYKLQGLSHIFWCDICGNASYAGRRNFERHFSEARHTLGLKSLGLENCKELHEITRIKDALAMKKRLEKLKTLNKWNPLAEECEDENGMVLDKQTYDLLEKQFE